VAFPSTSAIAHQPTAERKVFQNELDLAAPNSVSPLRLGAFAAAPLEPCKYTKTSFEMTMRETIQKPAMFAVILEHCGQSNTCQWDY
jgi:hypothetical protein